jgi:hypothetical protein
MEAGFTTGSWTLLKPDTTRAYYWTCECACGTIRTIRDSSLKSGKSSSCGCVRTQVLLNRKTHGMTNTAEYRGWQDMKSRCLNPKNISYKRYGGRGITVSERWLNSFENFYADMGDRPEGEHISLGRIDNDGPYSRANCRWENPTMQNRNKGNNVQITSQQFGTRTLTEWAGFLVEHTGDTTWNTRALQSHLKRMTIDQILKGLDFRAECAEYAVEDDYELIAA